MKKIISVSVYGTNNRYFAGAIENAKIAKNLFPDWTYKVYLGNKAPDGFKQTLLGFGNTEIIDFEENFVSTPTVFGPGVFWRFLEIFKDEDQIMICRDSDTRLLEREKKCIDEWIQSDKKFSIIRDHPAHFEFPIIATMWGMKGRLDETYREKMKEYEKNHNYLSDQYYLQDIIWPIAKNNCLIHEIGNDSWFSKERDRNNPIFIGQGYYEDNNPIYPSWK
jgi:hypothetical protein